MGYYIQWWVYVTLFLSFLHFNIKVAGVASLAYVSANNARNMNVLFAVVVALYAYVGRSNPGCV
jgi:hypothetical protein